MLAALRKLPILAVTTVGDHFEAIAGKPVALAADDSRLALHDTSVDEIYALDLMRSRFASSAEKKP